MNKKEELIKEVSEAATYTDLEWIKGEACEACLGDKLISWDDMHDVIDAATQKQEELNK